MSFGGTPCTTAQPYATWTEMTGTLVLQRQSNPRFKGNSPPGNCHTYTGFGCWCDIGDEIFYLDVVRKKKNSKKSCVRKQNVNTGDDVCMKHSVHTSNQVRVSKHLDVKTPTLTVQFKELAVQETEFHPIK